MISHHRRHNNNGFVLVIVLALMVVLALLAAAVATSAERTIRAAQADSERFQAELDMASTRETILFMLSTQRQTLGGLTVAPDAIATLTMVDDDEGFAVLPVGNEIRLDSSPYQGLGAARFALQDDRGLLSLNWAPPLRRIAFYKTLGVPQNRWAALDAKRLDYQDADDMHRLNGAEKDHYRRAGLPPPSNRTLATPLELRRIMDLGPLLAKMDDAQLLSMMTTARSISINLNTAPVEVLTLLPGLSQATAERMVQLRRTAPFVSVWQTQQTFGIASTFEDDLNLFSGRSGNLVLWNRHGGTRQLLHWTLTPSQIDVAPQPWRIDYEVTLPRGNADEMAAGRAETPLLDIMAVSAMRESDHVR